MPFRLLKHSFAGGILSPSIGARVDLSKYHIGAADLKNFIVHSSGGISNRAGLEFVSYTKNSAEKARLISFIFSRGQAYNLEFGVGYIRFYTLGKPIMSSDNQVYEISSPYKEEDLPFIRTVQSSDVLYLYCQDKKPMRLIRRGHTAWELSEFQSFLGPFLTQQSIENHVKVSTVRAVKKKAGHLIYSSPGTFYWTPPEGVISVNIIVKGATASYLKNPFLWYEAGGNSWFGNFTAAGQTGQYGNPKGAGPDTLILSNVEIKSGVPIKIVVGAGGSAYSGAYQAGSPGLVEVIWPELLGEQTFGTMESKLDMFKPGHVGALWRVRHHVPSQQVSYPNTTGIKAYSRWYAETSGYWSGTLKIEKYNKVNITWDLIKSMTSSKDRNYSETGEVDEATLIRITGLGFSPGLPAGTTGDNTMLGKATLETLPATYDGVVRITEYVSPTKVNVEIQKEIALDDTWTNEWAEGAWSDLQGYPTCGSFYQDRMITGGTLQDPLMTFMSHPGDYSNHGTSLPLVDSDGVMARIIAQRNGRIRSIIPIGDILVLTDMGEFRVSGSRDGAISPTNVDAQPQGNRGSSGLEPVVVGNQIIYVQAGGSVVRDFGYSFEADGYTGTDLTMLASHLFEGYQMVDMDYQQQPYSVVWCVRSDGVLLGLTYQKDHDVWAWHYHTTDGKFEAVSVIPQEDGDEEIWVIVNRDGKRMVERVRERMPGDDPKEAFFVDCGMTYRGNPARLIGGLDHLAGKEVAILADGAVVAKQIVREIEWPDKTKKWGIELAHAAEVVHVGLAYESRLETLRAEIPGGETLQSRLKKIAHIVLRVDKSIGAIAGSNDSSLDYVKFGDLAQPIGSPVELFSGDKKIRPSGGFDEEGRMIVLQRDPLPLTILTLIPKLQVSS